MNNKRIISKCNKYNKSFPRHLLFSQLINFEASFWLSWFLDSWYCFHCSYKIEIYYYHQTSKNTIINYDFLPAINQNINRKSLFGEIELFLPKRGSWYMMVPKIGCIIYFIGNGNEQIINEEPGLIDNGNQYYKFEWCSWW